MTNSNVLENYKDERYTIFTPDMNRRQQQRALNAANTEEKPKKQPLKTLKNMGEAEKNQQKM